jgi:pseudouridine-5'-phosphate glycosidase
VNARIDPEVVDALRSGTPVVAMESTITSNLGLPSPANEQALARNLSAVRAEGAVPAVTAIIDGEVRIGVPAREHERLLGEAEKVAARDIGPAVATATSFGATTVSASLAIASAAGIDTFATGGIGGVHLGATETGDVSADLDALARYRMITVCAGAKAFLDLDRTMQDLETRSVPVIGFQSDELPMFTARSSGLAVPHRLDRPADIAAAFRSHNGFVDGGMLVCVPVPAEHAIDDNEMRKARDAALDEALKAGVHGGAVTPFVLASIAKSTGGASVRANLALAENNATVAAKIAAEVVASGR